MQRNNLTISIETSLLAKVKKKFFCTSADRVKVEKCPADKV